ncbi:hypothetical protein IFM89_038019, partial [Coptis chinensis]
ATSGGDGVVVDPCTSSGYAHDMGSLSLSPCRYLPSLHAKGNFSESVEPPRPSQVCEGKEECSYQRCHIGNTFVPEFRGRLLATENFFYTSKFFGLFSKAFISDLMLTGEKFCGEDWSKLQKKYHTIEKEDLLKYCFSSAYIVAFLHDSLGIALGDGRIGFMNQVGDIPLDWALGAFIMQNMSDLDREHSD